MKLRSCISALPLCLASLLSVNLAQADTVVDHCTYWDGTRASFNGSHIYVTGGHYLQDYNASPDGVYRGTINYDAESPFGQGGIGTKFASFTFSVGFYKYLPGTIATRYFAYTSNDNVTFTQVTLTPTLTGASGNTNLYNLDTGPISARFMRFVVVVDPLVPPATSPGSYNLPIYQISAVTQAPANAVTDNGQTSAFGSAYSGVTPSASGLAGSAGGYVIYDATTALFKGTPNSNFTSLVFNCSMSSTIKDVQKLDFKDIYKVDVSADQITWQPLPVTFTAGGRAAGLDMAGASAGPFSRRYVRVSIAASASAANLAFTTRASASMWDPCIDYTHAQGYSYIYTDQVNPPLGNHGFHQSDSTNTNLTGFVYYNAATLGGAGAKFTSISVLDTLWVNTITQYGFGYNDKFAAYVSNDNVNYTQVPLAFGNILQYINGYDVNNGGAVIPINSQFVKITNTTLFVNNASSSFAVANNSILLTIGAKLTGNLALEGVSDLSAISPGAPLGTITFDFRNPGATSPVFSRTAAFTTASGSANGVYTFADVPYGTYDIAVKGNKNLRVVLSGVLVNGTTAMPDILLPAGDANNDNVADTSDFNILAGAFGAAFDPAQPNSATGYEPTADFNFDGIIDTSDFNLLVGEFGNAGAP